ncbi:type I methionyl aminopeptidase [Roseibacillus ishigakijimensis]|uniref:Methionine aminopeptidase n=1 Tax=Roseibacillus ishigakijimensis TaxID=454146 RepID=A0A934VLH5_9BACT|nr:type I methionyl aminopeptidase [Roseibacillus ishigakijimensis]MBK1834694.1 type I methionyl aminopeptidase [Roseibacillus ishigakijimensis]
MAKKKKNRIPIKGPEEIKGMREAGKTASEILQATAAFIEAGKSTAEIDAFAAAEIKRHGCTSAFLGYRGFPGNVCVGLNECVVHGIGREDQIVQDGDIVKIDVGIFKNGWVGDNATTVPVGKIDEGTKTLLAATEQSLFNAIEYAVEGNRLWDLCGSVNTYVRQFKFTVVRDLVGHGVGRDLHEEPQVPNYRPMGRRSPILKAGMVLAIEPMVNAGTQHVETLEDGWTLVTEDRANSAHFEHTVLVGKEAPEILTWRPRTALPEQLGIAALT